MEEKLADLVSKVHYTTRRTHGNERTGHEALDLCLLCRFDHRELSALGASVNSTDDGMDALHQRNQCFRAICWVAHKNFEALFLEILGFGLF